MQRAVLTPRALVWPLRRCAVGSQHRRGPLAPRAGAMDSDLAAVRREAAARHAAAAAAQAAAPGPPSPAAAGAGAGSGGGSAEAASLALAQRLQAEEDAAARRLDDDDEVQIIDPPPKRQRQGPPSRAPVVADGIGFALTHCNSASSAHNVGAVSLADIFPLDGRTPRFVILSNYMIQFPWLTQACPALLTAPKVFMLTSANESGGREYAKAILKNFEVFAPEVKGRATHHSKFIIVAYATHVRVCIHTANYLSIDWADKTQGVWMQDFPLKAAGLRNSSAFENDLVDYMKATGWPGGKLSDDSHCNADSLRAYDYTAARVALVASVPGSHLCNRYGTRRVRWLLEREAFDEGAVRAPLVWQFSSNGTVKGELLDEFRGAFCAGRTAAGAPLNRGDVQIVWPTEQEVRCSYEGWRGGTSIPGERKNIRELEIRELHHRWAAEGGRDSCPEGRGLALPHIKTFLRHRGSTIFWMLLGSHNLSRPAWGYTTDKGRKLTIGSYELGVMFLPSLLPPGTQMRCTAAAPAGLVGNTLGLRVPYALPPLPYGPADEPWDWETPRAQLDRHGHPFPGVNPRH